MKNIDKNIKEKKGFVILYAVMLSSMLLAIALGVTNISLQEIKFSTSAKNANEAFSSADTGAECALFNDKSTGNSFVEEGGSGTVQCLGGTIALNGSFPIWNFIVSGLGNSGQGCAKVVVDKSAPPITTITSKGYNMGDGFCSSSSPNLVEREIQVTYASGSTPAPPPAGGTGGTITTDGAYTVHTFTSGGTFNPGPNVTSVAVLVVAGGGGGGNATGGGRTGGGGGAGGLIYNGSFSVSGQDYAVTVGNGGGPTANGSNSIFRTLTAIGGGHGGQWNPRSGATSGGSGGGAMHNAFDSGKLGTPGQGNRGGNGFDGGTRFWKFAAGGGGGAGSAGANGTFFKGGNGGTGSAYSISGSSVYYAGGGAGGGENVNGGTGGNGGGGNGGRNSPGGTGIANTGGGGGGGGTEGVGGAGGSGIVIIRYLTPW